MEYEDEFNYEDDKQPLLTRAYETMRYLKWCKDKNDFCDAFLSRHRTYITTISSLNIKPSREPLENLKMKLERILDVERRSTAIQLITELLGELDMEIAKVKP